MDNFLFSAYLFGCPSWVPITDSNLISFPAFDWLFFSAYNTLIGWVLDLLMDIE